jgi:hypothetical protein
MLSTSVAPGPFIKDLFDFIAISIVGETFVVHYGWLGITALVRILRSGGFKLCDGHNVMYLLMRRELYTVC